MEDVFKHLPTGLDANKLTKILEEKDKDACKQFEYPLRGCLLNLIKIYLKYPNIEKELLQKEKAIELYEKDKLSKQKTEQEYESEEKQAYLELSRAINYYCKKKYEKKEGMVKMITLFMSYAAIDAPIADLVEERLKSVLQDKIKISRYTELEYKMSFKKFMDSIQEHDFVLSIVSDGYLKSKACMYEIGKVVSETNYRKKLLFLVLSENERKLYKDPDKAPKIIAPSIYSIEGKLGYVNYWQKEAEELEKGISEIKSRTATAKLVNGDFVAVQHIADYDIDVFTDYLSDANGLTFKELEKNNFEPLVNWMIHKNEC